MLNTNSNVVNLNSFFEDPRPDELEFDFKPSSLSDLDDPIFGSSFDRWEPLPIDSTGIDINLPEPIEPQPSIVLDSQSNEIIESPPLKPQRSKKLKKRKRIVQKNRYYDKNVCRNILRRAIRCIDSDMYQRQVSLLCADTNCSVDSFRKGLVSSIELLIGPSALRGFFDTVPEIAEAVKAYLRWFLRERYIREALSEGHMKDIKRYVEYKNRVLLYLVE